VNRVEYYISLLPKVWCKGKDIISVIRKFIYPVLRNQELCYINFLIYYILRVSTFLRK